MANKLTQEEYENRVKDCVGDRFTVISQYLGKTKPITLHCNIHNIDFTVAAECFMRGKNDIRGNCPKCSEDAKNKRYENNRINVKCAYCGKEFHIQKSHADKSKSGLYFCCREHKDLAQRVDSGEKFDVIRPEHYGTCGAYRQVAFRLYPHKCCVCGWDEDERILEVHHKDENHDNNDPDNLCIICPICHRKITLHYYKLLENYTLEKM